MRTYGLYGKSGTGKSYHAMTLARALGADALIDDGLFIFENMVRAGISAKRQQTKVGAIKTALFTNDEHAEAVKHKIQALKPSAILILGTSPDMIKKIAARLELPEPERMVDIEAITTQEERATAAHERFDEGKHVIPVPTFQIKRQFSGYFVDPLSIVRDLSPDKKATKVAGRTVVRPTYSYLGSYKISDAVIRGIVSCEAQRTEGVANLTRVLIDFSGEEVTLTLGAVYRYGENILKITEELQRNVREQVEHMTAFNVADVHVDVRGLKQ